MHGEVDKIVPYDMGKKMYELANEPKFFYSQKYGDHMIEYDEKLISALKKFILKLKLGHNLNNLITQLKIILMMHEEIIIICLCYFSFYLFNIEGNADEISSS